MNRCFMLCLQCDLYEKKLSWMSGFLLMLSPEAMIKYVKVRYLGAGDEVSIREREGTGVENIHIKRDKLQI